MPSDIQKTPDSGFIAVGLTFSNDGDVTGNHGGQDAWIVKMDSEGTIEWQRSLGGSGSDEARAVDVTSDGGYIIAGISESHDGDASVPTGNFLDYWIVKLSSQGEVQWQKSFGGTKADEANAIRQTIDGGYIVVGAALSADGDVVGNHGNVDFWVLKLRSDGTIEWQKALGGLNLDSASGVKVLSNGYLVYGAAGSSDTGDVTNHHGNFDGWVVKLSLSGDLIWQKTLGGSKADYAHGGTLTPDGGIVIVGPTKSTDGDIQNFFGVQDISLYKLNKDGQLMWQKSIGGSDGESSTAIQYTNDGGFILAGNTWSSDGDVTGSIIRGKNDFWVVKLSPESVGTEIAQAGSLALFPNPTESSVTIGTGESETWLEVAITDILGRRLLYKTVIETHEMDVSKLPTGLYLVSAISDSGKRYVGKLEKK